jgi:hypothetical protein
MRARIGSTSAPSRFIVFAQPVAAGLKLRYLLGEGLQRCHDILARLVRHFHRLPGRFGFARQLRAWLP